MKTKIIILLIVLLFLITGAGKPENIILQLSGNTEVAEQLLMMAKMDGIDVEIVLSNGFRWEIPTKTMATEISQDIDMGIEIKEGVIPPKLLQSISRIKRKDDYLELRMQYKGDLGFEAILYLPVDKLHENETANLYYYDEKKEGLVLRDSCVVTEEGMAVFQISQGADYLVLFAKEETEQELFVSGTESSADLTEHVELEVKEHQGERIGIVISQITIICLIIVTGAVLLLLGNARREYLDEDIDDYLEITEGREENIMIRNLNSVEKDYYDEDVDDYREKLTKESVTSMKKSNHIVEKDYYDEDIDDYRERQEDN